MRSEDDQIKEALSVRINSTALITEMLFRLLQKPDGFPVQKISGNKAVCPSPELSLYTVVEPALSVAVRVDYLLRPVFLSHICENTALLQYVRWGIVQEHDEFPESVRLCQFKRFPKALLLPLYKLPGMLFFFFIPPHNASAPVKIERSLECEPLCPDKCVIAVRFKTVLQKCQPRTVQLIELCRFLNVPEHIVISPGQYLSSRQVADILQVRLAFRHVFPPAMVPDQDKGVLAS